MKRSLRLLAETTATESAAAAKSTATTESTTPAESATATPGTVPKPTETLVREHVVFGCCFQRLLAWTIRRRHEDSVAGVGISFIRQDHRDEIAAIRIQFGIRVVPGSFDDHGERSAAHPRGDLEDLILAVGSQLGRLSHEIFLIQDEVCGFGIRLHLVEVSSFDGTERVLIGDGQRTRMQPTAESSTAATTRSAPATATTRAATTTSAATAFQAPPMAAASTTGSTGIAGTSRAGVASGVTAGVASTSTATTPTQGHAAHAGQGRKQQEAHSQLIRDDASHPNPLIAESNSGNNCRHFRRIIDRFVIFRDSRPEVPIHFMSVS